MPAAAQITVHESQFPGRIRAELIRSLRSRQINHKFHYDSVKQAQKWLALHEACSPARTQPDCIEIYERGFQAALEACRQHGVHVVGLGCGGGQKEARLLQLFAAAGKDLSYSPVDVSQALVLTAWNEAVKLLPATKCFPFVCDLALVTDWNDCCRRDDNGQRLFTFFGMLPNFEPEIALARLGVLLHPGDLLLISANLSPGNGYEEGIRRVLPLYDNALTRDWLMSLLTDLGLEKADGRIRFEIELAETTPPPGRIVAWFDFLRARTVELDKERFEFRAGESLRLFYSYRHTPELVRVMLEPYGLAVEREWIASSGEEAVFLLARSTDCHTS